MPKGKKGKPADISVTTIFEQFVGSLGLLIKEKVTEAVTGATNEFFSSKFGAPTPEVAKEKPPRRKRRRGRKSGKKAVSTTGKKGPGRPAKVEAVKPLIKEHVDPKEG